MNNQFFPSSRKENAYAPGECRWKDSTVAASTTIGEWAGQKANSGDEMLEMLLLVYLHARVGILGRTSKRLRAIKGSKEVMLDVSPQLSHLTRGWLNGEIRR